MESNWRYNVAELGQADGTWRLAARLLGPQTFPTYLVKLANGLVAVYAVTTAFPAFWVLLAGPGPPPGPGGFPYGFGVEPD